MQITDLLGRPVSQAYAMTVVSMWERVLRKRKACGWTNVRDQVLAAAGGDREKALSMLREYCR